MYCSRKLAQVPKIVIDLVLNESHWNLTAVLVDQSTASRALLTEVFRRPEGVARIGVLLQTTSLIPDAALRIPEI
jgi:hypothetical protein